MNCPNYSTLQSQTFRMRPDEHERTYAAARARYLELRGEKWPPVAEFRERVLGRGRLLSPEAALALVRSPLAAYVSPDWFESEGVPIVGHDAQVLAYEQQREGGRDHEHIVFYVEPSGRAVELIDSEPREQREDFLRYRLTGGAHPEIARVRGGSILHDLHNVSGALAGNLFADEADAARFVLTGEWPQAPPLAAELGVGTITITAAPWVSAQNVSRFFLQLQRRYREGDNRRVGEKALAVLLFVTEHTDEHGRHPSFEKLTPLWNERYPKWRFGSRFGLYDAYRSAEKVLVPAPLGGVEAP